MGRRGPDAFPQAQYADPLLEPLGLLDQQCATGSGVRGLQSLVGRSKVGGGGSEL